MPPRPLPCFRGGGPESGGGGGGGWVTGKVGKRIAVGGREGVERQKASGVSRRLVSLVVSDPAAYAWGGELLLRDGEPAGFASSAAFGHTVGRAVLLGYVERRDGGKADRDWLSRGSYQVAIGGGSHRAATSLARPVEPAGSPT